MLTVTLLYFTFFYASLAVPQLSYPFNSQVPPVARVGQQYRYTFPSNTFSNYQTNVVYSLSGAPAWLTVDSQSRTLSGTPAAADAGSPSFSLVATDQSGAAIDPVVLVVSTAQSPYVLKSIEDQLRLIGAVDGRGGLVLAANTPFTIPFAHDTFAETGGSVSAYYGTSDNYTPLPSWIFFNPDNIEFTGTTPPVVSAIAPPQYFEFVLVGTDYPGFAGVSAAFKIVIGAHQLAFSTVEYTRPATIGSAFSFQIPLATLILDGASISAANIVLATANNTGSFLQFDSTSYTLSGTPKAGDQSTKIVVSFTDTYGDVASLNLLVNIATSGTQTSTTVFTSPPPPIINATAGTFFSYTFDSSIVPSAATLNVTISNAPWLTYNSANRTLYGLVPTASTHARRQATANPSVQITAGQQGQTQTSTISINVVPSTASITTSATSSSTIMSSTQQLSSSLSTSMPRSTQSSSSVVATPTQEATNTAGSTANGHHGLSQRQKLAIGLGVSLPILAILAAILLFCCCRRKRSSKGSTRSPSPSNISRPINSDKDEWPQANSAVNAYDEPRQLGAFEMFKSTSEGQLSGYAMEVTNNANLAAPLAPIAHTLPPLPASPSFDAVRSAFGSERSRSDSVVDSNSLASHSRTLSVNTSIGNVQPTKLDDRSQRPKHPRQSVLAGQENTNRDSTNTMDSVSTDELFSVRLIDEPSGTSSVAPPLTSSAAPIKGAVPIESGLFARRQIMSNSETQNSSQTIGTYTSSEGEYIQRYGSQGESLSSGAQSRSQISRNDSRGPQPWRVMRSQDSYGSFGSYATTGSNLSDEFSFDESLSGSSNEIQQRRVVEQGIAEEPEEEEVEIARATKSSLNLRPESDARLLEAPLGPNWATSPQQAGSLGRRPTINERVMSSTKGKLMETPARRPMSSPSIATPDTSAETSGEIAFV